MTSPDPPPKKLLKDEHVEGIDLSDFDGEAQKVAGLDVGDGPKKPAPPQPPPATLAQRPMPPSMDLPEGESSAPTASAHRATRPHAAPTRAAPSAEHAGPAIAPAQGPESSPLAPSGGERAREPPRPRPGRVDPAPSPPPAPTPGPPRASGPASTFEPVAEPAPAPAPQIPAPAEAPAPVRTAAPVPTPSPVPRPYAAAPTPYPAPYPYPQPYPSPYPAYPPYPTPGTFGPYPYTTFTAPLPPRPAPSPTVEGLYRLRVAAGLAIAFFVLAALHRIYAALTGANDIPGGAQGVPPGVQFLSYFLWASEAAAAALAMAACTSGLLRLRESKAEARIPAAEPTRRPLQLLALALIVPVATGLVTWVHMSSVQRSLPGLGTTSDLGLALLFDEYRATAFAVALAGLAASFLIVLGLRAALLHLAPFVPRRVFRQFAALFVLGSATFAAVQLVVLYTVLQAPTRGAPATAHPELLLLVAGPALSCIAFLRLRSYLGELHGEAERRHAIKPGA